MSNIIHETSKSIAGLAIRTTNNNASDSIPALWAKFYGEGLANNIESKIGDDIYAVYTNFQNEGANNDGEYTFLIGVEVSRSDSVADGLDIVTIPTSNYHRFHVANNNAENVFSTWMEIWPKEDIGKTFVCDFELYSASGDVSVNVGTTQSD